MSSSPARVMSGTRNRSTDCPRTAGDLVEGFEPENALETAVGADPELVRGLAWGEPRPGHPEGRVARHVADLLTQIDLWAERGGRRADLRFIALVHDSFKYREHDWLPHAGPNHHAARARRFAERHTADERLLAVIELHDRPYHLWRRARRLHTGRRSRAVARLLERLPDVDLFVRFVELDGSTEGKDPDPFRWFTAQVANRARP